MKKNGEVVVDVAQLGLTAPRPTRLVPPMPQPTRAVPPMPQPPMPQPAESACIEAFSTSATERAIGKLISGPAHELKAVRFSGFPAFEPKSLEPGTRADRSDGAWVKRCEGRVGVGVGGWVIPRSVCVCVCVCMCLCTCVCPIAWRRSLCHVTYLIGQLL